MATFFSPSEVVAQSTDPFVGSEQYREGSPEPGDCGGQGLAQVPPRLSTAGWPYSAAGLLASFPGRVLGYFESTHV